MGIIECHDIPKIDMNRQDGGLKHLNGVLSYEVRRCLRSNGDYTYNHAPMLACLKDRLILSYISGRRDEHVPPVKVMFTTSGDGRIWEEPREIFPFLLGRTDAYRGPLKELMGEKAPLIVHHRMSFYRASDGVMLSCAFYGFSPDGHMAPNNGYGVGRLVRRIYDDYTFSDIYVLKYNEAAGFNEKNSVFCNPLDGKEINIPLYTDCGNKEMSDACDELINNRLITEQWYEEERFDPCHNTEGKAISLYRRPDGNYVGLCKKGEGYILSCDGKVLEKEKIESLITNAAKVWGQRLKNGGYAICFNPSEDSTHRWPLAIMTGDNGHDFYNMRAVLPEIPPYRYEGRIKNLGAQYMRGICDYNGYYGNAMWLAYSTNKEDIWVSSIDTDKKYSIMAHAWSEVKESIEDERYLLDISDWDMCQRVVFEYFPDKGETDTIEIDVKKLQKDNRVCIEITGADNKILCTGSYDEGRYEFDTIEYAGKIERITVYSKEQLALNTIDQDGRRGGLPDMPDADYIGEKTQFCILIKHN